MSLSTEGNSNATAYGSEQIKVLEGLDAVRKDQECTLVIRMKEDITI